MTTVKLGTQVRQEQIARAALGLLATHGLQGLNIERVAQRIGMVPSAIYRHFKVKKKSWMRSWGLSKNGFLAMCRRFVRSRRIHWSA